MNPERWREIQDLYHQASLLPEAEREAYLEAQTQYAGETIAEVRRLLCDSPPSEFVKPLETKVGLREAELKLQSLGEFDLIEEIGRGGMGVVYRARQRSLGRIVAIKILPGSWAMSQRQVDRFQREARSVAKLSHPNIISVFSVGQEGPTHYFAMELVEGRDLRSELKLQGSKSGAETTLPPQGDPTYHRTIAELVLAAAEALQHAHARGVVHRDVKPSNILLAPDGTIKVVDFGLSRDEEFGALTLTGELAGTPQYMSPEQVRRKRDQIDHRTDIYSLGVVLYELLTGVRPFDGAESSKLMHDILVREARSLRVRVPSIPANLETICLKALEKDQEHRYQSAAEFAGDLKRFLNDEPVLARRASRATRFVRKLKREPRLAVAALFLLALASISYAMGTSKAKPPLGSLSLALAPSDGKTSLVIVRIDSIDESREAVFRAAQVPSKPIRLEPGLYRCQLHQETEQAAGFAELTRIVAANKEIQIDPVLRTGQAVFEGMLPIPGGEYTVGRENLTIAPQYGTRRVTVRAFWIDRTEVSNKAYLEYLQADPAALRPLHWPAANAELPEGWGSLPVIGIPFEAAQGFAEWSGKRLPTAIEWEVAASGGSGAAYPWGSEPGDLRSSAVVQRWTAISDDPTTSDRWKDYGNQVVAVQLPYGRDLSPFGLLHSFGNVREWTESPSLILADQMQFIEAHHIVKGLSWYSTAEYGEDLKGTMEFRDISHLVGFRCAKSDPGALEQPPD